MGWRQGRGIGKPNPHQKVQQDSKWGPMANVSVENVQIYRLDPKDDVHGLGYDPFKVSLVLTYQGVNFHPLKEHVMLLL